MKRSAPVCLSHVVSVLCAQLERTLVPRNLCHMARAPHLPATWGRTAQTLPPYLGPGSATPQSEPLHLLPASP